MLITFYGVFFLQQAYNAIAVSRQMKLLALNSSNKSSRENSNSEKPKEEEVNPFFYNVPQLSVVRIYIKKNMQKKLTKIHKVQAGLLFFFKMALGAVHK